MGKHAAIAAITGRPEAPWACPLNSAPPGTSKVPRRTSYSLGKEGRKGHSLNQLIARQRDSENVCDTHLSRIGRSIYYSYSEDAPGDDHHEEGAAVDGGEEGEGEGAPARA